MVGLQWAQVPILGWAVIFIFLLLGIAPIAYAWRQRIPISLAIVISLLACWFFQSILQYFDTTHDFLMVAFATNPMWQTSPFEVHRLITAGWLHAVGSGGSDIVIQHILGNVLVIALVGVPLEQRLGRGRFLIVYLLGVLSGNLAWWFSHWGEFRFALGASGAAFGLLGTYLACWPRDEIEFPLVLIRKWPVSLIALVKLGLEIAQVGMLYGGWQSTSSVAHLAHIGGFFVCYAVGRRIAKGGPTEPEIRDLGPSASAAEKGGEFSRKGKMGGLKFDPWEDSKKPLEGAAKKVLARLREEGDELETRRAWLEELAEVARCPLCEAELAVEIKDEVARLACSKSRKHLLWP